MADAAQVIARFRAETVPGNHALVMKALAFHAYDGVSLATPVDTGRARASWNMAAGEPDLSVYPAPARRLGKLGKRIARSGASIGAKVPTLGFIPPGTPIWITNNLPYIRRLNAGWSKQAPAGFVENVVNALQASWNQIVKSVVPRP